MIRTVLFGLTGFGNEILRAIRADSRLDLAAVFTRSYPRRFRITTYANCTNCAANFRFHAIRPSMSSGHGFQLLTQCRPDLILMAGFHQILGENVLALPRFGS